jgi:hypothetical protein
MFKNLLGGSGGGPGPQPSRYSISLFFPTFFSSIVFPPQFDFPCGKLIGTCFMDVDLYSYNIS